MAARFIGGLAIGIASLLAPLYIAEISPAAIRGRLVALNQMAIVSGILLAYLSNWLLSFLGAESWRWMFLTAAVPSLGFLWGLFYVPESPRWLVEMGRDDEALNVLTRVDGQSAPGELAAIRETIAEESGKLSELLAPGLRKATIIALTLAVLQQITGINTNRQIESDGQLRFGAVLRK
jgi:SP family arabinose:H+ symporter-like MFS transporter